MYGSLERQTTNRCPVDGLEAAKAAKKVTCRGIFFRAFLWMILKHDRAALEPECIRMAIEVLRHYEYRPAIDVLFKYLDFRPFSPDVPGRPTLHKLQLDSILQRTHYTLSKNHFASGSRRLSEVMKKLRWQVSMPQ